MINLLLASFLSEFEWWQYLIAALVLAAVFGIIFTIINRHFRVKYDFNLIWGGVLVLIAVACIAVGIALITSGSDIGIPVCVAIVAVGLILYAVTIIYNVKRLGSAGITAIILQTIFCLGCLIAVIEFFRPDNASANARENARIARERKNYLDRNGRE